MSDNTTPNAAEATTPSAAKPELEDTRPDSYKALDNVEIDFDLGVSEESDDDEQPDSDDDETQEDEDEDSEDGYEDDDSDLTLDDEADKEEDSELDLAVPLGDDLEDDSDEKADGGLSDNVFDLDWVDDARDNLKDAIAKGDAEAATRVAKGLEKRLRQFAPLAESYARLDASLSDKNTAAETVEKLLKNLREIHGEDFMASKDAYADEGLWLWGEEYESAGTARKQDLASEFLQTEMGQRIEQLLKEREAEQERKQAAETQQKQAEALRKRAKERMPAIAERAAKEWPGFELTQEAVLEAVVAYPELAQKDVLAAVRVMHGREIERYLMGVKSGKKARADRPGIATNQRATVQTAKVLTFGNADEVLKSLDF